jgi:hypothetical protein
VGVDFSASIASVTNDAMQAEVFVTYLADPGNTALCRKNGLESLFH